MATPNSLKTPYEYRNPATGEGRYTKIRLEYAGGKKAIFIDPKGRGGSPPLLYGGERLADLREGQPVWIVEGEKKVDRLRELGAIAVSGDSGASSKWLPSHAELLRGLPVILWPDSDEPGEKYIANAAAAIRAVNPEADLRVVRPFGAPNGAKGRDVCDWTGNADHLTGLAAGAKSYAPGAGNGNGPYRLYEPPGERANEDALPPEFTEDRLALDFASAHANELRYVAPWGKWLAWTGTHWEIENTLAVFDMARKICRAASARCNKPTISSALAKAKVEMLARSDRRIAATKDQWDSDFWRLNHDY